MEKSNIVAKPWHPADNRPESLKGKREGRVESGEVEAEAK